MISETTVGWREKIMSHRAVCPFQIFSSQIIKHLKVISSGAFWQFELNSPMSHSPFNSFTQGNLILKNLFFRRRAIRFQCFSFKSYLPLALSNPCLPGPTGHLKFFVQQEALLERSVKGKFAHPGRLGCKGDGQPWDKIQKESWPWENKLKDQKALRDGNANGQSHMGQRNLNWKLKGETKRKVTADLGGKAVD